MADSAKTRAVSSFPTSYTWSLWVELSAASLAAAGGTSGDARFRYPCSEGGCVETDAPVPFISILFDRQIASRMPMWSQEPDVRLRTRQNRADGVILVSQTFIHLHRMLESIAGPRHIHTVTHLKTDVCTGPSLRPSEGNIFFMFCRELELICFYYIKILFTSDQLIILVYQRNSQIAKANSLEETYSIKRVRTSRL